MELKGKKALFLVENGFCEREFLQTQSALTAMGVDCRITSSTLGVLKAWNQERQKARTPSRWGADYAPDKALSDIILSDYHILVLPGGQKSIDKLKVQDHVRHVISHFMHVGAPIITYNRAIELLRFFGLVNGYSVAATSDSCDLVRQAGGRCAAPEFVVSKNLVSMSRFRDVEDKIQYAVRCIFNNEPYSDKIVSSDNGLPSAHKVA